ncbi:hypothetical protein [Pseudomaricurvus sp. HS19]|uniref:hypothetical protein n=1 Tax=Pseudomaricurvus sp. HS19 TaxID=2692626 RepID=UPI00136FA7DD|nr:hypothetical protein [Pseudomaricurvus sp. HS19]MYM61756.1 hypothetical protein [Pseudomaricurvus sp. HS19]
MKVFSLYRSFFAALALCAGGVTATAAAPAADPFASTVAALQGADPQWRADFARIALTQLAEAYIHEAELALTDPKLTPGERRRWSRGVEQYGNQLLFLQMDIEAGQEVNLYMAPATGAVLEAGGQQVVLTFPRPRQQLVYEQTVLEQYCQLRDCSQLAPGSALPASPRTDGSVTPLWSFTEAGGRCSYDGLKLQFSRGGNLSEQRQFCHALLVEVMALVNELIRQQQYGVHIDWLRLSVTAVRQGEEHAVRLNSSGDSVLLPLPVMAGLPQLLPRLHPWLAGKSRGEAASLTLSAGDIGWAP